MAYNYGPNITFGQSMDFTSNAPLDIRVSVPTQKDLESITHAYIGLLTYVSIEKRVYVCESVDDNDPKNNKWNPLATDSGIPIYTTEMYNKLDNPPEKYIHIHDES